MVWKMILPDNYSSRVINAHLRMVETACDTHYSAYKLSFEI